MPGRQLTNKGLKALH